MIASKVRYRIRRAIEPETEREATGVIVSRVRRNVCRVRTDSGHGIVEAINTDLPCRPGLPVRLRHDGGAWRVVGIDFLTLHDPGDRHYVPEHAEAHRFSHNTGEDVVWLDKVQYTPLLVAPTVPPSLRVRVMPGSYYDRDGMLRLISEEKVVDLSGAASSAPSYALVAVNLTNGELATVVEQTQPRVPPGFAPLGLVRLRAAQSAITWDDIVDARDVPSTFAHAALATVRELSSVRRCSRDGTVSFYTPTPEGVGSALSDARPGDVVVVPVPLVLGDVSVPQGVTVDFGASFVRSVGGQGTALRYVLVR